MILNDTRNELKRNAYYQNYKINSIIKYKRKNKINYSIKYEKAQMVL